MPKYISVSHLSLSRPPQRPLTCAFLLLLAPIDADFRSACLTGCVLAALLGAGAASEADGPPSQARPLARLRLPKGSASAGLRSGVLDEKLAARRVRFRVRGWVSC